MKKIVSLFLISLSFSLSAATLNDINFPDSVKVEGKELVLNGMGIRKATIFKVKVYYAGLYLDQKSKDPNVFLASNSPKQIIMHFVRDVGAKKLQDGFLEGMEAANNNFATFKAQFDKFNSHITDMKENDLFTITFSNTGVLMNIKGHDIEKIAGADFSRALLNIWFTNPRDENLRDGLLSN